MKSFKCMHCLRESRVKQIKVERGQQFLVCEWCSAEHPYSAARHSAATNESLPDIEITGVRPKPDFG